jgi:hypothetical protein
LLALGGALASIAVGLSACTAAASQSAPSTHNVTITETPTPHTSTPSVTPTGALNAGAITTTATDCPLIAEATAADALGQRLARVTVQSAAGKVVGCQFFDVQGTALAASEHLSGPNQPALQITSARYANATLAHNAMVRTAEAGANAHQSGTGLAYQTTFDPIDGANHDWAFTFAKGATLVVVRTNEADSELNAEGIGAALVAKF